MAFSLYLYSTALFWYLIELIALEHYLLSSAPVSELCISLISQFKEYPGIALYTLISSRLTFYDIRSSKTIRIYIYIYKRYFASLVFLVLSLSLILFS
jgi:hypothetical protein